VAFVVVDVAATIKDVGAVDVVDVAVGAVVELPLRRAPIGR